MSQSFQSKWETASQQTSPLCVGVDPSIELLTKWGLKKTPKGLREFGMRIIEAAEGMASVVKPQVAFFEAFGPEGFTVLQEIINEAKSRDLLVLMDVKRGDIGSSSNAYADAWLTDNDYGFNVDAITVNPYLGFGSLEPIYVRAVENNKGVFVVVHSSNEDGRTLQSARIDNKSTIADHLATEITSFNVNNDHTMINDLKVGCVGAVIGATLGSEAQESIDLLKHSLFLAPGVGAQGATIDDIATLFGPAKNRVLVTASRIIAEAGPDTIMLKKKVAALKAETLFLLD